MSFILVSVVSGGIKSGGGGVVLQSGGSFSQTLLTTNAGSKRISPVFFYAERIVVSLKGVLQKALKALRNSTLENVLSPFWIASFTTSKY